MPYLNEIGLSQEEIKKRRSKASSVTPDNRGEWINPGSERERMIKAGYDGAYLSNDDDGGSSGFGVGNFGDLTTEELALARKNYLASFPNQEGGRYMTALDKNIQQDAIQTHLEQAKLDDIEKKRADFEAQRKKEREELEAHMEAQRKETERIQAERDKQMAELEAERAADMERARIEALRQETMQRAREQRMAHDKEIASAERSRNSEKARRQSGRGARVLTATNMMTSSDIGQGNLKSKLGD